MSDFTNADAPSVGSVIHRHVVLARVAVVLAASLLAGLAPAAGSKASIDAAAAPDRPAGALSYPRLAGMLIGDPKNYDDPAYQARIARLDLAILGIYDGWSGDGGSSPAEAVAEIKTRNPRILLGNYTVMTEVRRRGDPATSYLRRKLQSEAGPHGVGDWWAYDADGRHTDWSGGDYGAWDTNLTRFTTPDVHGERWPQWLAGSDYDRLIRDADFDLWYSDNNMWQPRSAADWNRDGVVDDPDEPAVQRWWRQGQRDYYETAQQIAPGLPVVVNADNDLDGRVYPPEAKPFSSFEGMVGGAFLEHVMGESWSVETWGGWSLMMRWYRHVGSNLVTPGIVVFDAELSQPTDYQSFRYAFASCLMGDGYFTGSTDYHAIQWYDEYDLAGKGSTQWLGRPLDPPARRPWQHGVYRREFQHGLVLVNPKGNGRQTVTVGSGFSHFRGAQDPEVNDGAPARQVTLANRDGVLLVRDRRPA